MNPREAERQIKATGRAWIRLLYRVNRSAAIRLYIALNRHV